jgi:hypothetical protein
MRTGTVPKSVASCSKLTGIKDQTARMYAAYFGLTPDLLAKSNRHGASLQGPVYKL